MTSPTDAMELLPCPFCSGSNVSLFKAGGDTYVQCADCTTCGPNHKNGLHWNRCAGRSAGTGEPVVPREPTEAMVEAGAEAYRHGYNRPTVADFVKSCYRAMWDAAPVPPMVKETALGNSVGASVEAAARCETPSSHWRQAGEPDPHGKTYDCERAALCLGSLTDDELASAAYLNYDQRPPLEDIVAGKAHSPIAYMTAVKDRIRWLSRKLEDASNLAAATKPAGSSKPTELPPKCEPVWGSCSLPSGHAGMHQATPPPAEQAAGNYLTSKPVALDDERCNCPARDGACGYHMPSCAALTVPPPPAAPDALDVWIDWTAGTQGATVVAYRHVAVGERMTRYVAASLVESRDREIARLTERLAHRDHVPAGWEHLAWERGKQLKAAAALVERLQQVVVAADAMRKQHCPFVSPHTTSERVEREICDAYDKARAATPTEKHDG